MYMMNQSDKFIEKHFFKKLFSFDNNIFHIYFVLLKLYNYK